MNISQLQEMINYSNFHLCLDYLSDEDWFRISKYLSLEEKFIQKYSNYVKWDEIWFNQLYSKDFLYNNVHRIQSNDWISIFSKIKPSSDLLIRIWNYLPFSDFSLAEKLNNWICEVDPNQNYMFKGNNFTFELKSRSGPFSPLEKWHYNDYLIGNHRIYAGNNAKLKIHGIRHHICCSNGAMIEDWGNGTEIEVGNNSCIISYQHCYRDNSRFHRFINGWGPTESSIFDERPDWTRHIPLQVKLGKNSSVIIEIENQYYTFKSGVDLDVNRWYYYHFNSKKWKIKC
jgi:hypothetical protein